MSDSAHNGTANGHTSRRTLSEARDELRLARTELRLREAHAQMVLLEGWGLPLDWGTYAGGVRGDPYDPLTAFKTGADRWFGAPTWGAAPDERRQGNPSPFITNEDQLFAMQRQARALATENPVGVGVVETLTDFLVGEGMMPKAIGKPGAEGLAALVQDVLDEFNDNNDYDEFQAELVGRAVVDGEYFEKYTPHDDLLEVRAVEPEHVAKPKDLELSDDWSYGIHTPENDPGGKPVEFAVHYGNPDEPETIAAQWMQHVKRNTVRNVKRGLSDFYPTAEGMRAATKLLSCMGVGESIRAAIVGFWQYESATAATVAGHVAGRRDAVQLPNVPNPITGKDQNATRYPPGSIPNVPKGKVWVQGPQSPATQSQVATVQALLRAGVGVRWRMPEYMISGDSSNANFSSTLVSGAPFVRAIRRGAKFFRRRFLKTYWTAVKVAHAAGRFGSIRWADLKTAVDIQLEPQPPEIVDQYEQAQTDWGDMDRGVMSLPTRRQRRGLDDEQERRNSAREPVTRVPGRLTDLDAAGNPVPAAGEAGTGGGGSPAGFFPRRAAESAAGVVAARYRRLQESYGPEAAAAVVRATADVLECGGQGSGKPGPCPSGDHDKKSGGHKAAHPLAAVGAALKAAHPHPEPAPPDPPGIGRPDLRARDPALAEAFRRQQERAAQHHRAATAEQVHRLLTDPHKLVPLPGEGDTAGRRIGLAKRAAEQAASDRGTVGQITLFEPFHGQAAAAHPEGPAALEAARAEARRRATASLEHARRHIESLPAEIRGKAMQWAKKVYGLDLGVP